MIFDFERGNAAHGAAFRALNAAWIERFFALEAEDLRVLSDPEGRILAPGGAILFAELGGEIVGTVALIPHGEGELELAKMAVDPKAQGRHLGRRLMDAALLKARALGARRVMLETNDKLTPAVTLYRSVGFVPVPTGTTPYARCNLTMALTL